MSSNPELDIAGSPCFLAAWERDIDPKVLIGSSPSCQLTSGLIILGIVCDRLFKKVWRGTGHFVSRLLSDYEFQLSKGGELEDKMKETLEASQIKVRYRRWVG